MNMLATLDSIITSVIYLLASFALFFIGRLVYKLVNRGINVDHELVEKDNLAFAMANTGYYVGLLIAIWSLYAGDDIGHIVDNLISIFTYGLFSIVLLNLSIFISDKLVLRSFDLRKEIIQDQNVGTGIIEAAICIANGLIIHGVLVENPDGFVEVLVLWIAAQIVMLLVDLVYNKMTSYDIHEEIKKNNVAAGIGYAGAIIALANLVRHGVEMHAESWIGVAQNLGVETGLGLLLLPAARFMTDKILLPGRSLTDEIVNQETPNIGAAVIEAFGYIGGSVLICLSFG
ncbi:MAG: DUF350 domain-containing protein [Salibacteraceae bacterium]|nr:DUF350 domain-containing protein [Salibacteraceae bacterium]|tara:strand:+ start:60708 stop:61571 length:864 start_codon:yes stop_codon:yes gene_type:complete